MLLGQPSLLSLRDDGRSLGIKGNSKDAPMVMVMYNMMSAWLITSSMLVQLSI